MPSLRRGVARTAVAALIFAAISAPTAAFAAEGDPIVVSPGHRPTHFITPPSTDREPPIEVAGVRIVMVTGALLHAEGNLLLMLTEDAQEMVVRMPSRSASVAEAALGSRVEATGALGEDGVFDALRVVVYPAEETVEAAEEA